MDAGGAIAVRHRMAFSEWKSPQDGVNVLLVESVVRGVRQVSIDGFVAIPRRGMEVGGVLLGSAHAVEIRIEAFEEVLCEHRYGPSYALSENDRSALRQMLASWPAPKAPVVGFFRSFTSRDPAIEDADEAFVREHFPQGCFVFLMVQPLSVENCVASFRFFRDGVLLPDSEAPPQPFVIAKNPAAPLAPMPVPIPIEAPPVLPPAFARRELHADERTLSGPARWWIPALMCLISAAAGALINQVTHPMPSVAREPPLTDLHVDARPVGGQLEVRWDSTPQMLGAPRGQLEVTDGDSRRKIELNLEQLRSGRLMYAPTNEDVRLRLSIDTKSSKIVGDALRVKLGSEVLAKASAKPSSEVHPSPAPEKSPSERARVAVMPVEVHTVQPRIPEGIRARIAGPVIIPVELEISERGNVVRAVAEGSLTEDSVYRYLAEQAQQAAMKWRFRPARKTSGDRIAASTTVHFTFTR
ncbi:MAG: hypothetical protein ABI806_03900 [Candidatus Solibacter sp.]